MNKEQHTQALSLQAWFYDNQKFFNLSEIGRNCDVPVGPFVDWIQDGYPKYSIATDALWPNEFNDLSVLLDWATGHGFGNLKPIEARFTVDAQEAKRNPEWIREHLKKRMAEAIGLQLLKDGFLVFHEVGEVSKPQEFRREIGFLLMGHAVKLPSV